jgi:hypothetical protein
MDENIEKELEAESVDNRPRSEETGHLTVQLVLESGSRAF